MRWHAGPNLTKRGLLCHPSLGSHVQSKGHGTEDTNFQIPPVEVGLEASRILTAPAVIGLPRNATIAESDVSASPNPIEGESEGRLDPSLQIGFEAA